MALEVAGRVGGEDRTAAAEEVVRVGEGEERAVGALGGVEAESGDALCVLLGLPSGTKALLMEVPCT